MSRKRILAASLLLAVALTGCGSNKTVSSESKVSSREASSEAASGISIAGDGFTFKAPRGWEENDGSATPSFNFLALAVDKKITDDFANNLNVLEDPTIVGVGYSRLEEALTTNLSGIADQVTIGDRITVDGETAVTVLASFPDGPVAYQTLQYVVEHEKTGYVLSFSFGKGVKIRAQHQLAESVVASWRWSS